MKSIIFFIILSAILTGCQSKSSQTGDLPIIDLSKKYPQKEMHLQSIATLEYLPLETNKDVLLDRDARVFYFSDKYILVLNRRLAEVFVFDRNGKNLKTIRIPKGNGPMELIQIEHILFDDKTEEIYLFDLYNKVLVYSLTGEHIRNISGIPGFSSYSCFLNFDEETFFCYQEYFQRGDNQPPGNPYYFISKKDGSIDSYLNINFTVRHPLGIMENEQTNDFGYKFFRDIWIFDFPVNRHYGQDFVIADISSDTIYRLSKNRELIPLLVRSPSVVNSSEPRTAWRSELATEKFIILRTKVMDFEKLKNDMQVPPVFFLMYEFETGQICEIVSFVIDDFPSFVWELREYKTFFNIVDVSQKNVAIKLLDVTTLKDAQEEKKLNGELNKLVETLGEEDNPVIMIVNFK